jgi:TolB-like protein
MTVARRGYRFIAPVQAVPASVSDHAAAAPVAADHTPVGADHTPVGADHTPVRPTTDDSGPRAIAVLDFDNVTGADAVAWLAAGIAETVTSDLAALGHFRVVDRWRVVQAARQTGGGIHETAAALGVALVVTGSYQQSGARLRITARVVDLERDRSLADAKVDGPGADIFALQDGIVPALARTLRLPGADADRRGRSRARETSNLEAYRAYTEGWLRIESLDTSQAAAAMADFERAIALDGRYALAYTGLATAELTAYEMTRLRPDPDLRALASGIEHARHAIRLDDRLADAHATLSFLLVSAGRIDDGRAAARQAVALEPDNWRHHDRLGHALWGGERLDALERALAIYPDFAYALLEMAMVHVARGRLDQAEAIAREGITVQDRQSRTGDRFPAVGFHWMLGALLAARGEQEAAAAEFDLELAGFDPHRLYAPEYAAAASLGRGHTALSLDRPDDAVTAFRRALEYVPGLGRASLGLALACRQLGDIASADAARADLLDAALQRRKTHRPSGALFLEACTAASDADPSRALARLTDLLALDPPSFIGWTIPIDPCFGPLEGHDGFAALLARLAERAA